MDIESVERLRESYVDCGDQELSEWPLDRLKKELLRAFKHRETIESWKKEYAGRANDTLKLVKSRLKSVISELEKQGHSIESL